MFELFQLMYSTKLYVTSALIMICVTSMDTNEVKYMDGELPTVIF